MKTTTLKFKDIKREWHLIDLDGQILGRISTQIATLLSGKNKINQSPNLDDGDYVIAINAKKIKLTGKKESDKKYYSHSGYPGGFKTMTFKQLHTADPRKVIERSVKGMLPKNKLQTPRLRRLKVFSTSQHPYNLSQNVNNQDKMLKKPSTIKK